MDAIISNTRIPIIRNIIDLTLGENAMRVCWSQKKQYNSANRSCIGLNRLIYLAKHTKLSVLLKGNEWIFQEIHEMRDIHIHKLKEIKSKRLNLIISYFQAFISLKYTHKKYKIDVLYTDSSIDWLFGILASFLLNMKLIVDFVEQPEFQALSLSKTSIIGCFKHINYKLKHIALRNTVKYADCVISQGTCLENGFPRRLIEEYGVKKKKILPLPIGIDLQRVQPDEGKSDKIAGQLKLIYAGYLSRWRGIDKLLFAMKKLSYRGPDIRLMLVGPFKDKNEEACLKRLIEQLGLNCREIYQGLVSHDRALELIMDSDVGVCPFPKNRIFDEAFALKIPEYLAMGKPVVATDLESIRPYVKNGLNGILTKSNNPDELANAFLTLYEDVDLIKRLGKNARQSVLDYDWDKINEKVVQRIKALQPDIS